MKKEVNNKITYKLVIDGKSLDFITIEDLINYLKDNWNENTYLASIRKMYGSGCCGFNMKGDLKL